MIFNDFLAFLKFSTHLYVDDRKHSLRRLCEGNTHEDYFILLTCCFLNLLFLSFCSVDGVITEGRQFRFFVRNICIGDSNCLRSCDVYENVKVHDFDMNRFGSHGKLPHELSAASFLILNQFWKSIISL